MPLTAIDRPHSRALTRQSRALSQGSAGSRTNQRHTRSSQPSPHQGDHHPGRCDAPAPVIDHGLRLRSLWTAWLLAMLIHVDLGLMPLFHGLSAQIESEVPAAALPSVFMAMMLYDLIPLLCLLLIAQASSDPGRPRRWQLWRRWHQAIALIYSITNLAHLAADILIPDRRLDQILLMAVITSIGLAITREARCWWRQGAELSPPPVPSR